MLRVKWIDGTSALVICSDKATDLMESVVMALEKRLRAGGDLVWMEEGEEQGGRGVRVKKFNAGTLLDGGGNGDVEVCKKRKRVGEDKDERKAKK